MKLNLDTTKTVSEKMTNKKWIQIPGPHNDMTFEINPDYKPEPRCKNCKFWCPFGCINFEEGKYEVKDE